MYYCWRPPFHINLYTDVLYVHECLGAQDLPPLWNPLTSCNLADNSHK